MQHVETLPSGDSAALAAERVVRRPKSKHPLTPVLLLGLSLASFVLTCCAEAWLGEPEWVARRIAVAGFGLSTLFALAGCVSSLANLWRGQTLLRGPLGVLLHLLLGVLGFAMTWIGAITTLWATVGFARGRQLRRFGRVLLPPVAPRGGWVDPTFGLEDAVQAPPGVGQQWRENGRTEHASVASFARLTCECLGGRSADAPRTDAFDFARTGRGRRVGALGHSR